MPETNNNMVADFRNIKPRDVIKDKFPADMEKEYRIFFSEEAYKDMKDHASLTAEVELAGVLIGDICEDCNGIFLKICGAIPGEHSNNYGAQVTFTHETWQHINAIKDNKFSNKRIVGWYHTHPGFGVFLSEMDNFIQENFFNQPYQIAVVIETKELEEGCFIWKDGKSIPISQYWIGNETKDLVGGDVKPFSMPDISLENSTIPTREALQQSPSPSFKVLNFALMVLLFLLGILWGKFLMFAELKTSLYEMLQSEFYSIMEYASMNTAASVDFTEIQKRLDTIKTESLAGNMEASDEIEKVTMFIDNLKTTYDKHRTRFRKDLAEMQKSKGNISQNVNQNRSVMDELKKQLAVIALMRVEDIVIKSEGNLSALKQNDKYALSEFLKIALKNDPSLKMIIEQRIPGLIKQIMPYSFTEMPYSSQNKQPSNRLDH